MKSICLPAANSERTHSKAVVPSSAVRIVASANKPVFSLSINLDAILQFIEESSWETIRVVFKKGFKSIDNNINSQPLSESEVELLYILEHGPAVQS